MYNKVLLDIYARSMLYAYTSKELYNFCTRYSAKVMRYKALCFGALLLLLGCCCPAAAAAAAALHRHVCVY